MNKHSFKKQVFCGTNYLGFLCKVIPFQKILDDISEKDSLSPDTEEVLSSMVIQTIEAIVKGSCVLSTHRNASSLEIEDIALFLKTQCNLDPTLISDEYSYVTQCNEETMNSDDIMHANKSKKSYKKGSTPAKKQKASDKKCSTADERKEASELLQSSCKSERIPEQTCSIPVKKQKASGKKCSTTAKRQKTSEPLLQSSCKSERIPEQTCSTPVKKQKASGKKCSTTARRRKASEPLQSSCKSARFPEDET